MPAAPNPPRNTYTPVFRTGTMDETERTQKIIRAYQRVSQWIKRDPAFIPSHVEEMIQNIDMAYWRLPRGNRRIVDAAGVR